MSELLGATSAVAEKPKKPSESKDKRVSQPMLRRFTRAMSKFFLVTTLLAISAFGAHANEPNQNHQEYVYVEFEPDVEDEDVEEIIENLQELRAGNESASTQPVEIMMIGNSIFTEETGIFSDDRYGDITITNLARHNAYFGQYGDPDNAGGFLNQQGMLEFIDARENNPTFVLFQFGSNEAQYINFDGVDAILATYDEATGRVVDDGGFTSQWLNEMFSMIDELKDRNIIPILGGGPRVRGVANSFQINTILVRVAELKGIPFIDATPSAEMTSAMYGLVYGGEILVDSAQSADGIHFGDISDLTPFLVEALQDIEQRTRPERDQDDDQDSPPPDINLTDDSRDNDNNNAPDMSNILDQANNDNDDNEESNVRDIRDRLNEPEDRINWPRGNN